MTNTLPENFDTLVREAMDEWQVPGLALAITRDGEGDWVKAYGLRDVEASLPVTGDTQFILCSVTKSFTALGLAILVDEGRLDWTKPVRDYLPEFRLHDAVATERVTVIDLLCHHTGLPRHDWIWMPADISRAEMLVALRYLCVCRKWQRAAHTVPFEKVGVRTTGAIPLRARNKFHCPKETLTVANGFASSLKWRHSGPSPLRTVLALLWQIESL